MIDWKSKLTSRKFWMAIVGLVSGILLALHMDEQTVTQISGIIMAGASVVAYIIGEGLIDAAASGTPPMIVHQIPPMEDEDQDEDEEPEE